MAMRKSKARLREGRLRLWTNGWLRHRDGTPATVPNAPVVIAPERTPPLRAVAPGQHDLTRDELKQQIGTAAVAFRGYDASNIGRGPELLAHAVYGPIVREMLDRASRVCADVLKREVDLAARVEACEPGTLETFVEDTATIVSLELAQVRLLEEVIGVPVHDAMLSFGHSIGELSALVLGGVYEMEQLLPIPLALAHDCADLTADTTLGILTSPSGTLEPEQVMRLCSAISSRGHGMVGPSTFLSPYQVILLGQADTLDLLEAEMRDHLPSAVTLRRRPNQWPPLHTPLVWERSVPNPRRGGAVPHRGRQPSGPIPTWSRARPGAPITTSGTAARSSPSGPTTHSGSGTRSSTRWPRAPNWSSMSGPSRSCSPRRSSGSAAR